MKDWQNRKKILTLFEIPLKHLSKIMQSDLFSKVNKKSNIAGLFLINVWIIKGQPV